MRIKKDDWLEQLLTAVDLSEGQVLEIGCGRGHATRQLAQICESITAVDADKRILEIAEMENPSPNVEYRCCQAATLPFGASIFHAAIFSFSFHHISPDHQGMAIQQALRVLKQGGFLVFLEPGFCGSLCRFEHLFEAGDGDERQQKIQAYASICRVPGSTEILESCAEKQIEFDTVEEAIELLKPKKGTGDEVRAFLERYRLSLVADRRINVFRKK